MSCLRAGDDECGPPYCAGCPVLYEARVVVPLPAPKRPPLYDFLPKEPPMKQTLTSKILGQAIGATAGLIVAYAAKHGLTLQPEEISAVVLAVYGAVYKTIDHIV